MCLFKKIYFFFQGNGLKATIKRMINRSLYLITSISYVLMEHKNIYKYKQEVWKRVLDKNLYVVLPSYEWNYPLFQRCHQIALVLSKSNSNHVIFVSDVYSYDNFAGIMKINEHLDVLSMRIAPKVAPSFSAANHVAIFKTWPLQMELLEVIPYQTLIYEYIDDFSVMSYITPEMKEKHYELMRKSDLTLCTAQVLYEDALPYAKKILLSPNAVDYEFFHKNRNSKTSPILRDIVQKHDCILGYYGCLANWVDYDLVLEVAEKRPNWCFVLIGYCPDGTIKQLQQFGLDNILVYPAQPYRDLPQFISAFDIQIIPFRINNITKRTSPVKLFEYMASGKPILTSEMPECLQYRSVITYTDAQDFIEKVPKLMELAKDKDYLELMDKEARENTWDARVKSILEAIKEGEKNIEP